jgi:hypothetical protein
MMLSTLARKTSLTNILRWAFGGLSIFFIAMLVFMLIHDPITGVSSQTAEYCAKYGFLASPGCW